MMHSRGAWLLSSFLAISLLVPITARAAGFSPTELACREGLSKNGSKLSKKAGKLLAKCHKLRSKGTLPGSTNCNSITEADTKGKISKVATKLVNDANAKCAGLTPVDLAYIGCPSPCEAEVPSIATFQNVADCIVCVAENHVDTVSFNGQGNPSTPLLKQEAKCHGAIGKGQTKLMATLVRERTKCQTNAERGGATDTSGCISADPNLKIQKAAQKARNAIDKSCTGVSLSSLDSCTFFSLGNLKDCVLDEARIRGRLTFKAFYELAPGGGVTTTTTSTTSTMGGGGTTTTSMPSATQDPQCPNLGELTLLAGVGETCATNGDCLAGTCDPGLSRCVTGTELDTGWTGLAHDSDINDKSIVTGNLLCPGPAPTCGACTVTGLNPAGRVCRCANNNRTVCENPFAPSQPECPPSCTLGLLGIACSSNADCEPNNACSSNADCAVGLRCETGFCTGALCDYDSTCACYFGAPLPLSSGNTPACVVNRFANDISGTANVDTGAGKVDAHLRSIIFTGETLVLPCPVCGGTCTDPAAKAGQPCGQDIDCDSLSLCVQNADCTNPGATCVESKCHFDGVCSNYDPMANDGVRGGTCFTGDNDGQSCDIQSRNTTFPAPQFDGGYSLDCFPSAGKNVSGVGLVINLSQTTGSVSLPANLLCGYPNLNINFSCPCGQCTGDASVACTSNADCTGMGLCQRKANGVPLPNGCDDRMCTPTGNGEGECAANFDDNFCDAIVRSNGEGLIKCQSDADCSPTNIGLVAGQCTLAKKRECFLDPIVASGVADAAKPFAVTAFCIASTSNAAINTVAGLPGPGRVKNQGSTRLFCASNPAVLYEPGIGGCP